MAHNAMTLWDLSTNYSSNSYLRLNLNHRLVCETKKNTNVTVATEIVACPHHDVTQTAQLLHISLGPMELF